ncbi:hypothetical protein Afil01_63330 [Actinorhabdospora filicis]|uniref:Uncharacterized protein n=1 Tax=Actinorhabdospora filicis TaxID=1785913 RepID=A0A9W6SSB5_9ACTN|nr:hypothetical protein [Actinorhabdospora filicis]GLZ81526.1 hypothetical protein Afil01_63330 [Actinorhabdospora filicis]
MPWHATEIERTKDAMRPYSPAPLLETPELRITVEGTRVRATGAHSWIHDTRVLPTSAHLNDGSILVLTDSLDYHAWGHLGPALLLDAVSGELVAELRGERGAVHEGGFLLGLEGYDYFDTWHYDGRGELLDGWRSYGHYLPGGIVVERDRNTRTSARIVRLLPGGEIRRGHRLKSGTTGEPVMLADGTILVADGGRLIAVDGELRASEMAVILRKPAVIDLRLDGDVLTAEATSRDGAHSTRVRYRLHRAR